MLGFVAEVNPDDFTRGLEEFCMLQETSKWEYVDPQGASSEHEVPHQNNNHSVDLNRQSSVQMQRGQQDDQWSSQRNGQSHADMYTMGYVDNMSGYFPNFCYPYPPPFHAGFNPFNMGVRPMYVPMMGLPYFPPPSHEFVPRTTDAITRASRKSRIARRRGQGTEFNAAANSAYHPRPPPKIVHAGAGSVQPQESTSHAVSSSGQVWCSSSCL